MRKGYRRSDGAGKETKTWKVTKGLWRQGVVEARRFQWSGLDHVRACLVDALQDSCLRCAAPVYTVIEFAEVAKRSHAKSTSSRVFRTPGNIARYTKAPRENSTKVLQRHFQQLPALFKDCTPPSKPLFLNKYAIHTMQVEVKYCLSYLHYFWSYFTSKYPADSIFKKGNGSHILE